MAPTDRVAELDAKIKAGDELTKIEAGEYRGLTGHAPDAERSEMQEKYAAGFERARRDTHTDNVGSIYRQVAEDAEPDELARWKENTT
jgi:hypothetical protein